MGQSKNLLERLDQDAVLAAEGYLFELERRGYLQAGAFVPEVVLEHPEVVRQLHVDFARAGSDVMEAFTYYGHREKLRLIGKEDLLEPLNRQALEIAKEVARDYDLMLAGDICNTNVFSPDDKESIKATEEMFAEQVQWAVEAEVDFIVAETYSYTGEALLGLEAIRRSGKPAVVMLALHRNGLTREGETPAEACKRLEAAGADVVGLNCARGPATMLPALREIRAAVRCHVAALPVPYRTTEHEPTFQSLTDPGCGCLPSGRPFPEALDPFTCNRYEMGSFAKDCYDIGIRYIGGCCGTGPHHIRSMAEALGRHPEASKYSADMSKHAYFGTDDKLKQSYRAYAQSL